MKNHLKRITAPRTWHIKRKENKFILRPNCGSHSLENGLPLGLILRDVLGLVSTMSEAEKLLNNNEVLVDGKRRKDRKTVVGLFDIVSIPLLSKNFQVSLNQNGRLNLIEVPEDVSKEKVAKVIGKTAVSGSKIQLNLYDGKNILTDKNVKVGDSVCLSLPDFKIKKVLPLKEGSEIFLIKGKQIGSKGKLKSLVGNVAMYVSEDGADVETVKKNLYVLN